MCDSDSILKWFYSSAWLAGIVSICYLIYSTLRKCTFVTVNCWFCNTNLKIPFGNKKEWNCTNCQQFNGFDKDGDYSKPIPEQYKNQNYRYFAETKSSGFNNSNGLCRICNANQELKIKQLALYEPLIEENYDQEIEAFRQRLEKSYKLCSICEKTVMSTLKLKSEFLPKVSSQFTSDFITESIDDSRKFIFPLTILGLTCFIVAILHIIIINEIMTLEDIGFSTNFFNVLNLHYIDAHAVFRDENVLNVALALFLTMYAKNIGRLRALRSVCLMIATFVAGNCLIPSLKITAIFISVVLWSVSFWRNRNLRKIQLQKLKNKCQKLFDNEEDDVPFRENSPQSACNVIPNPLCDRLSDLNLGQSRTMRSATTKRVSYLFKPTKLLIQPARLKIDDTDWSDTARSTPTVSSGYDSVTSFWNRSPDSISEFDSVSQVDRSNTKDTSGELRWRNSRMPVDNYKSFRDDMIPLQNMVSYRKPLEDHYYGVSTRYLPNCSNLSNSSHTQINSLCSTIQILLFSSAFFILGFLLQIFLAKLQS